MPYAETVTEWDAVVEFLRRGLGNKSPERLQRSIERVIQPRPYVDQLRIALLYANPLQVTAAIVTDYWIQDVGIFHLNDFEYRVAVTSIPLGDAVTISTSDEPAALVVQVGGPGGGGLRWDGPEDEPEARAPFYRLVYELEVAKSLARAR